MNRLLRHLPNAFTGLRLLLSLPLGALILREHYAGALVVGLLAGLTDALDGYAARRLQSFSPLGAMLDPVADKVLVTVAFISLAFTGLVPWPVAAVVVGRDLVIICGALAYRLLIGPIEFAATGLSKLNMGVQIGFCVLVLAAQLLPDLPVWLITGATFGVLVICVLSGLDYVISWSLKAVRARRAGGR